MFKIRVFAPPSALSLDASHATGELVVSTVRLRFGIDLRFWSVADYQRQWTEGIKRIAVGAPTSALVSSYRGDGHDPHTIWALWREGGSVFVQPQCILPAELEVPFDPSTPYAHVATRIPATEESLPIEEWRVELEYLIASAFNIRWPFGQ